MSVGESYALKVEGDSMINEGIHEGDTVLIKKTNLAENGDIIVALIDDHEATLKRLRKKGHLEVELFTIVIHKKSMKSQLIRQKR